MSKRWTMEDDEFLAAYADVASGMADYVASHDLGHHGKNAGANRIKRLKETGVWDKLIAYQKARDEFRDHWLVTFSSGEGQYLAAKRLGLFETEGEAA
jgi:hypothetical protein